MGYRSDVAVIITAENKDNFKRYVEELKSMQTGDFADEIKDNGVDGIRISFSDIKWYRDFGFEEIDEFEEWLDKIEEDGESYHFVRIGEDLDDVEENIVGDPKYWVYIERKLEPEF